MVDSGCGKGGGWKSSLGKSILSAPFFFHHSLDLLTQTAFKNKATVDFLVIF